MLLLNDYIFLFRFACVCVCVSDWSMPLRQPDHNNEEMGIAHEISSKEIEKFMRWSDLEKSIERDTHQNTCKQKR